MLSSTSWEYSFLKETHIPVLHKTFLKAFADYQIDMSYMTEERMYYRAIKNGVDYECSVGTFYQGKMVGFTFIGIDKWQGKKAAFDAGTGIIPDFRGKSIAKGMFDYALPKLRDVGVKTFVLEVLQKNEAAVRAYQKVGFQVVREFDCYQQELKNLSPKTKRIFPIKIKRLSKKELMALRHYMDWPPSWENSFSAINRIKDEVIILGAWSEGSCIGYIAYYPLLEWIMNLAVKKQHRQKGIAAHLLQHLLAKIKKKESIIKVNNVIPEDEAMRIFLQQSGFKLYVKQYEMAFDF
jgi:ribosomal protein S18 acetylase RimI-like enzyme